MLVTNLYNHTQPLIRYEVTDQVTLIAGRCPCGSSFRRIEDPQGRLDDIFDYADGLSVHPHVFRSALGQQPAVIEYQVSTDAARGDHPHRDDSTRRRPRALKQRSPMRCTALGLADPRVAIETVAALPRQASGKLKRFVPLSS